MSQSDNHQIEQQWDSENMDSRQSIDHSPTSLPSSELVVINNSVVQETPQLSWVFRLSIATVRNIIRQVGPESEIGIRLLRLVSLNHRQREVAFRYLSNTFYKKITLLAPHSRVVHIDRLYEILRLNSRILTIESFIEYFHKLVRIYHIKEAIYLSLLPEIRAEISEFYEIEDYEVYDNIRYITLVNRRQPYVFGQYGPQPYVFRRSEPQ